VFLGYFHIAVAGLGVFMIGANIAFMIHLGQRIFSWFQFKMFATTLLLIYVTLSVIVGGPPASRTSIAAVALVIDCLAIWRMYANMAAIKQGKITF